MPVSRGGIRQRVAALLTALSVLTGMVTIPLEAPIARADGIPGIVLTTEVDRFTLHGDETAIRLVAANPSGVHGYNASFLVTLDPGFTYKPGSSSPAPVVRTNDDGSQVLYWENVSDLLIGAETSISFVAVHDAGVYGIGDTPGLTAGVYVNSDARDLPDLELVGEEGERYWQLAPGSYTGWATGSGHTEIVPFLVERGAPNRELLRGVHDQKHRYFIEVENNPNDYTTGLSLDDYLPAGIEYLGCAPVDNSADGFVEVLGKVRIDAAAHPGLTRCKEPSVVETVVLGAGNPMGLPAGVYTHLHWTSGDLEELADLAPGGTFTIDYAIAIPLRENVAFGQVEVPNQDYAPEKALVCIPNDGFDPDAGTENPRYVANPDGDDPECIENPEYDPGSPTVNPQYVANPDYDPSYDPSTPETLLVDAPTDGYQTANLDNNTGPLTYDEQPLHSYVSGRGTYLGSQYEASHGNVDEAEDLIIIKTASREDIVHFAETTWTLTLLTSEYAVETTATLVTDDLPTGLTPTDDGGGDVTGSGPYTISWVVPSMDDNDVYVITFKTVTEPTYHDTGNPVVSEDDWVNSVVAEGTAAVYTDSDGSTASVEVVDSDFVIQEGDGITISKQAALPAAGEACDDDMAWGEIVDVMPGDRVCFLLRVDFPDLLDSLDFKASDFLPRGFTLESVQAGAGHSMDLDVEDDYSLDGRLLDWDQVGWVEKGSVFEVIVSTIFSDPVGLDVPEDVTGNLLKVFHKNTRGEVFQHRDDAQIRRVSPLLTIDKRIEPATTTVVAGDVVTYVIEITNEGEGPAHVVRGADVLPEGLTCSDVSNLTVIDAGASDTISCASGNPNAILFRLGAEDGSVVRLGPDETVAITYDVTIPSDASANAEFTNAVSVTLYQSATNVGSGPVFGYKPTGKNVCYDLYLSDPDTYGDHCGGSGAPVPEAFDRVTVLTPEVGVAKTVVTTSVVEIGNDELYQATVGEVVSYEVTAQVPAGVTAYEAVVTDTVPAGLEVVEGSILVTLDDGPVPGAWLVDYDGVTRTIAIQMGDVVNGTDDPMVVKLRYDAVVADVAGNLPGASLDNLAVFDHDEGGAQATASMKVVEPNLQVQKAVSVGNNGIVRPGDVLTYTITVTNPSATGVSPAHGVTVSDLIPDDLIVDTGSLDGGTYSAPYITWELAPIPAGGSVVLSYQVEVRSPILNTAALTNFVTAAACSLDHGVGETCAGEGGRTYTVDSSVTVQADTATVEREADRTHAGIGETVTHTIRFTLPAGITGHDFTIVDEWDPELWDVLEGSFTAACVSGCDDDPIQLLAWDYDEDTGRLYLFFGDYLDGAPADRVFEVTVAAVVRDHFDNHDGSELANTARLYFAETDVIDDGDAFHPGLVDDLEQVDRDDTVVTVIEPHLVIDKRVDGQADDTDFRRAKPGDRLRFTITVTNTGNAPAHGVDVLDGLGSFPGGTVPALVSVDPADYAVGPAGITWHFDVIDPDGTVVITYEIDVPSDLEPDDAVLGGPEYRNVAEVLVYTTDPANPEVRTYSTLEGYEMPSDQVDIHVDLGRVSGVLWWDVDGDGSTDADEPRLPAGVRVELRWHGPNGTAGDADDEVYVVTTDGDGRYLAEHLPPGQYTITVVGEDVPAGLAVTYEAYPFGPNDGAMRLTLSEGDEVDDADVGFGGTGALGGFVWFDQDRDGSVDTGEPGLDSMLIEVVWAGWDGDFGAEDDNDVFVLETIGGAWDLTSLPAGKYRVTVHPDAISGLAVDGDLATQEVELATGEVNTDLLFPYTGEGQLGGRIYLDNDQDGSYGTGDTGFGGVDVYVQWYGLDGLADTDDDGLFVVTTRADGTWSIDGLASGGYRIYIDPASPVVLLEITEDPDDTGDTEAEVTLGFSEAKDDLNWGLYGGLALGGTVYHDWNANGSPDPGENGAGGIKVTLVWAGLDGVFDEDDPVFETYTDADGTYYVEGLPAGQYKVIISDLPAGMVAVGSDETTLTLDSPTLDVDFGITGTREIGGRLWFESRTDGWFDPATDWPLKGREIELVWAGPDGEFGTDDDQVVGTVTTDGDGLYGFGNLPQGEFLVRLPEDHIQADIVKAHDCSDAGTCVPELSVTIGGSDLTDVDFVWSSEGSVGGKVYLDHPGVDPADAGIEGVTVRLEWEDPVSGDTFQTEVVTDADGNYLIEGVPGSRITVTVVDGTPEGTVNTSDPDGDNDGTVGYEVDGVPAIDDADFGYRGTKGAGGKVFYDVTTDSSPFDPSEDAPIANQRVDLIWFGPDGQPGTDDDVVFTTTTGEDGNWELSDLPVGEYRVVVVGGIADWATVSYRSGPGTGSSVEFGITVSDTTVEDVQIGFNGTSELGGTVYLDRLADGDRDADDPGLEDIQLRVTWHGPDGVLGGGDDIEMTVYTSPGGSWTISGIPGGTYTVAVEPPYGYAVITSPSGGDEPYALVTLGASEVRNGLEFGIGGTVTIGDLVFWDVDGDGTRDTGEPGVPGARIELAWAGPDGEFGTADDMAYDPADPLTGAWSAQTGADGAYQIPGLPYGSWRVRIVGLPSNLEITHSAGATPSDTVVIETSAGEVHDHVDFGVTGTATIGDEVFFDLDHDGVRDDPEPGLAGAEVTLTWVGLDGILGTPDDVTVTTDTGPDGRYLFTNVPGRSLVRVTGGIPGGVGIDFGGGVPADAGGLDGEFVYDLNPGIGEVRYDVDFPLVGSGSLSGHVWYDDDGDGVADPTEADAPGIAVEITWIVDGEARATWTVVTGPDGRWTADHLPPGVYEVRVGSGLPSGHVLTTTEFQTVVLGPGDSAEVAFGIATGSRVSGVVWWDTVRDGRPDGHDQGAAGVRVHLIRDGFVVAETTTDMHGRYAFDGIAPGVYEVKVDTATLPANARIVFEADGSADGTQRVSVVAGADVAGINFGIAEAVDHLPFTGPGLVVLKWVAMAALAASAIFWRSYRRRMS